MRSEVHDFHKQLEFSHECADAPFWSEVYRRAFPRLEAMVNVRKDGWAQRGGIDRQLTLSCGRVIPVDEKVRKLAWPDFALERWSDRMRQVPGWVQKPLACEFIAYAWLPICQCYLLPCEILQRAWRIHGRHWIDLAEHRESGFRTVLAPNKGYQTESVAVPIPVLLKALTEDAMLIEWGQPDDDTQPQLPLPLATATGQLFLNFGGKN